jgi:hypothetical protein
MHRALGSGENHQATPPIETEHKGPSVEKQVLKPQDAERIFKRDFLFGKKRK